MVQYVVDLKDLGHEKIHVEDSFEPGVLDYGVEGIRQVDALKWSATIQRADSEIRVTGSLTASIEQACSRCLEPARFDLTKPFDLYFAQRDEAMFDEDQEVELSQRDTQTAFFTGTQLLIGDVLREQVLLGLPMKALCRLDCKGLCPRCGTNLNVNTCNCPVESFSPHMDKLLQIKKRLEDRSS